MGPQRMEATFCTHWPAYWEGCSFKQPCHEQPLVQHRLGCQCWSWTVGDGTEGSASETTDTPCLPLQTVEKHCDRMHNIMPADCSQHHQKRQRHTVCKLFAEQARSTRSVNCFLTVHNVRSTSHKLKRGQLYCQEISTNSVPSCFRNPYK